MATPEALGASSTQAPRRKPGLIWRVSRITLLLALVLIILLIALVVFVMSPAGLPFVLERARPFVVDAGGTLNAAGLRGSLWSGIKADSFEWSDGKTSVRAEGVDTDWALAQLWQRKLVADHLRVVSLQLILPPGEESTAPRQAIEMPASLALPIEVQIKEIRLDRFELLTLPPGNAAAPADDKPAEPLLITGLGLRLAYQDETYTLDRLGVRSPWGSLSGGFVSMGAAAPHPISLKLDAKGKIDPVDYQLALTGDGDLNRLGLSTNGQFAQAPVKLSATLNPLALSPLKAADLSVLQFEPRQFGEALPTANLDLAVKLRTRGEDGADLPRWRIDVLAENASPGALDAKKIPLRKLSTQVFLDDPMAGPLALVRLQDLVIDMPGGSGAASITGQTSINLAEHLQIAGTDVPVVQAALAVSGLDIAQFATPDLATSLSGEVTVDADGFEIDLKQLARKTPAVAATAAAPTVTPPAAAQAPAATLLSRLPSGAAVIRVSGKLSEQALGLEQALVQIGKAKVQADGRVQIVSPMRVDLQGTIAHIDLNQWIPKSVEMAPRWRQGLINASWQAAGAIEPAADVKIGLTLNDSSLAGRPLSADLKARLKMLATGGLHSVTGVDARLGFGKNKLNASGNLFAHAGHGAATGKASETTKAQGANKGLDIVLNVAEPGAIDPRAGGSAELKAHLSGALDALHVKADLSGSRLRFAPTDEQAISLRSIDMKAELPLSMPLPPDAPLFVDATLGRLQLPGQRIDKTTLNLKGSANKHQLRFSTRLQGQTVSLAADGKADLGAVPGWQGMINSLSSNGKIDVQLRKPVPLKASAERVELDGFNLRVTGRGASGGVSLDRVRLALGEHTRFEAKGGVDTLPFAQLATAFTGEALPDELYGLRLGSAFDLQGTSADDLNGRLGVELIELAKSKKPIGLAKSSDGNRGDFSFRDGNISGRFALALPSLAFTRRFTEPDLAVDGRLDLAGSVSGRLTEPKYNATINGSDIKLEQFALGLVLEKGVLDARVTDRSVDLREFALYSGDGKVELKGQADLLKSNGGADPAVPITGRFDVGLTSFALPIGPGQRIVLSGQSRLLAERSGMTLRGDIKADEGLIEVAGSGAPGLPDDVQIVEPVKAKKPAPAAAKKEGDKESGLKIDTLLNVDLGEKLRITGSGLNAMLAGKLQIKGELPSNPRIEGLVNIANGSYTAYSQDLSVRKGEVRFNGPVDNPSLNIEAVRPKLPVIVGVAVRGTALSPRIELFSDPSMENPSILSWLVLGVPIDNAQSGAQSLALKEAAATLLGSGDGSGESFSDKIGLDSLGFGYASDTSPTQGVTDSGAPTGLPGAGGQTADSSYQEVVTLGKKLSDKLSVSYEAGVSGLWNLLRIQYELNKRLSLRAQTGSENAVDLLYSWTFD